MEPLQNSIVAEGLSFRYPGIGRNSPTVSSIFILFSIAFLIVPLLNCMFGWGTVVSDVRSADAYTTKLDQWLELNGNAHIS